MTPNENWRPIPGYEGYYEVSDQGRVRSLDRNVWVNRHGGHWKPLRGKLLKTPPDGDGYPQVGLHRDGVSDHRFVHRLVMLAFVGPQPDGLPVCHYDDVKTNNHLGNLRYGTAFDNQQDSVRLGGNRFGGRTACANGHNYSDGDYYLRRGVRVCRPCKRDTKRRAYYRNKSEAA